MRAMLRNKIWLLASHLAAVTLAVVACGNEPDDGPAHYQFALAAFGGDTTVERARAYDCFLYGFFELAQPVPASGVVRFPVRVERRLFETRGRHSEVTSADTAIAEAVLNYAGLGGESLQFVLGAGPYTVSLGPGGIANNPAEYEGEWTCGPEVPLGQDSTLLAYGYAADLQIPGTWRVSELLPIE